MIRTSRSASILLLLAAMGAAAPTARAVPPAPSGAVSQSELPIIPVQRDPSQRPGEQGGAPAPGPAATPTAAGERKAILDAFRVPIERDLKQPVVFAVQRYRVIGDWAFVMATPKRPGGGEIAWARTVCSGDVSHLAGGLMKREAGRWIVRDYALCPTDVAWDGWPEQYGAPRALFQ